MAGTYPDVSGQWISYDSDGTTFSTTASAGTFVPAARSSIMTINLSILSNAVLSLWTFRMKAAAASWS